MLFRDRRDAGRFLARRLKRYAGRSDVLVLALPRGGVLRASDRGRLFHEVNVPRFWIDLDPASRAAKTVEEPRLERAIGVIYRPESERQSHYFKARLPQQFDAVLHYDQTRAVEPLERNAEWIPEEVPETFPTGV